MCAERVRGGDGDGNAGVRVDRGVVAGSAGCEYICDTCGSVFLSTSDDVLEMSVLRGVKGGDGVCEMCMGLARNGVGGEWIRIGLYQYCRNKGSV